MRAVVVLLVVLVGCRSARDEADAGGVVDASADALVAAPVEAAAPPPATTAGEWERDTPPYEGLRIAVDSSGVAKVTRASVVDDPKHRELACQASLWKPGDVYLESGTVVVRDWGLVAGRCEHRDTRAPATLALGDAGDTLVIAVKRGKTALQTWSRVVGGQR